MRVCGVCAVLRVSSSIYARHQAYNVPSELWCTFSLKIYMQVYLQIYTNQIYIVGYFEMTQATCPGVFGDHTEYAP